jgi:hypothetical protein
MASELEARPNPDTPDEHGPSIEMPRPTAGPLVFAAGIVLLAAGAMLGLAFLLVGAVIFIFGLAYWVTSLLPGKGHWHEPVAEEELQARPVVSQRTGVEQLEPGMIGYRAQLPEKVQPISAGVKGGIVGGIVMPLPALIYSLSTGHGVLYPLNLLAGMVVPSVGDMSVTELEQFHFGLFATGLVIHVMMSLVLGLIYGVLLPTLPEIPSEAAWGGLLMPLLWSGVSFLAMAMVNPAVRNGVSWPFFMLSQFTFGVVAASIVHRLRPQGAIKAGIIGGAVGGVLMVGPALFWAGWSRHSAWYPVNLLAGMVVPGVDTIPAGELDRFHPNWIVAASIMHGSMAIVFGIIYALFLHKLPRISGAYAWGGLLFPILWTGVSYGLMGLVNPVLRERVDWPWFVVSQFVFGATAAFVVGKSEMIRIPPAGGESRLAR